VKYIVEPDRTECADIWNILYSQTGQSALLFGIYFRAIQATLR